PDGVPGTTSHPTECPCAQLREKQLWCAVSSPHTESAHAPASEADTLQIPDSRFVFVGGSAHGTHKVARFADSCDYAGLDARQVNPTSPCRWDESNSEGRPPEALPVESEYKRTAGAFPGV